ncbi:MAG: DsbA family oxidoreductase [Acetobacteraceae bacterium]|nr:DsbA family oxidoreductase [Acetobacteraceae bacterium]
MSRLDVYSDVICPWCYIGKRHMEVALAEVGAQGHSFEVSWRPFQLNPDMPAGGVARDEYRRAKFGSLERSRELDAQVASAASAAGLEIRHDRMARTPNTLAAHRLIQFAGEQGRQDSLVDRLFEAYFVEGRDIGERETLIALAASAGLDAAETAEFLDSGRLSREVQAEDQAVRQAGLNGVPTFVLERHVLFSGAVPPDVFAEALIKAQRVIAGRAA